jgi:nicotinamidase-related amidase
MQKSNFNSNFLPTFYNKKNAADFFYNPNLQLVQDEALAFARQIDLAPAAGDGKKVLMLNIDLQRDFCHPEGTLYVGGRSGTGAIDDSARIAEFIYRNLDRITKISSTLDTHWPWQIFFAPFFVTENGEELQPHTLVDVKDVNGKQLLINLDLAGNVIHENIGPNPRMLKDLGIESYTWAVKQCKFYCESLKNPTNGRSQYALYLWPIHCQVGSIGHALVGVIDEARHFHAYARASQPQIEIKGGNPWSENYSIVQPELLTRFDGLPLASRNTKFLDNLLNYDAVIIAGQASSHCVASSIDDILFEIKVKDPKLAEKVYILSDCTSAVAVPDGKGGFLADFTPQAEAALKRFSDAGMHVVKSTDSIDSWLV